MISKGEMRRNWTEKENRECKVKERVKHRNVRVRGKR
jgi:hypothetical protein